MNRLLGALALIPCLAACVSISPQQRLANNRASCQAYGFRMGTDAYANCMLQRDFVDRQEDVIREDRLDESIRELHDDLNS